MTSPWIVATYEPTALFSLKPASATSSGGKSLLIPTPFAIKMALLDVACRTQGLAFGEALFDQIKALAVAVQLPEQLVVNNTFIKIMRPNDAPNKGKKEEKPARLALALANKKWPMGNTIAFREYVSYHGVMTLALQGMPLEALTPLLLNINYFGKRGGFFQLQAAPHKQTELDTNEFTILTDDADEFLLNGMLQMLDDCGEKMTFEHANIYSGKRITLGKERVLRHIVLPYQLARSSKGFSYYRKVGSS